VQCSRCCTTTGRLTVRISNLLSKARLALTILDILLTPWTQPKDGQLSRQLICTIGHDQETDRQTLDVCNDHLCYVVTQTQSPWQLPMSRNFLLLSKFVITHSAKSKCKLAIFNKVVWNGDAELDQRLSLSQRLIQKQALRDYQDDAVDLAAVITDQVSKLGAHSTNKAAQIFGSVGQSTQTSQVSTSDLPTTSISRRRRKVKVRTLTNLYTDEVLAQAFRLFTMLIDLLIAIAKSVAGVVTAHKILVLVLACSTAYNTWYGYRDGLAWYDERRAGKFMARLGVKPDPTVARAVYLSDIEELVAPTLLNTIELNSTMSDESNQSWNSCQGTFRDMLASSEPEATTEVSKSSSRRSQQRLQRTRHSLAGYRHDLLVALRVINRVEEEVVHAEWQDWVFEEERKCIKVETMMRERNKGGKPTQSEAHDESDGLGDGFAEYCRSCKSEASQILSGK
jgi:hypothetical protein